LQARLTPALVPEGHKNRRQDFGLGLAYSEQGFHKELRAYFRMFAVESDRVHHILPARSDSMAHVDEQNNEGVWTHFVLRTLQAIGKSALVGSEDKKYLRALDTALGGQLTPGKPVTLHLRGTLHNHTGHDSSRR
jgi:hypothetical protein